MGDAGGMSDLFRTEADMVAAWLELLGRSRQFEEAAWTVYPETAGWDLLLVHQAGYQVGIEAKLSLNAKVLCQALAGSVSYWRDEGPDYRGVLVPDGKLQKNLTPIARALGIGILTVRPSEAGIWRSTGLPSEDGSLEWPNWCPSKRCPLPEYIPDVTAGHPSPLALTAWKIKAIRLMILLERRGFVTRADMKALQISPTRWCDHWHGFLAAENGRYVRCSRTPDLKAQHPRNWAEIEADFGKWCPPGDLAEIAA
jgi:hypothetical protein